MDRRLVQPASPSLRARLSVTNQLREETVKAHGIRISMDGKGRWRDNVFVERLWKSGKYEEVYLCAYDTVSAARAGLSRYYFAFYNTHRPHTALDRRTPDAVYFESLPLAQAA